MAQHKYLVKADLDYSMPYHVRNDLIIEQTEDALYRDLVKLVSIATFGLPQTAKHLCNKVMDLVTHDSEDKCNVGLVETMCTATMIAAQVKLMQEVYGRFL